MIKQAQVIGKCHCGGEITKTLVASNVFTNSWDVTCTKGGDTCVQVENAALSPYGNPLLIHWACPRFDGVVCGDVEYGLATANHRTVTCPMCKNSIAYRALMEDLSRGSPK